MNLLALFLYELNYGFGTMIQPTNNNYFVYKNPDDYVSEPRFVKGQYEFKKMPFKPFLMTNTMKELHNRIHLCLSGKGCIIDFEEFVPDIEVARGVNNAILVSTFLAFAHGQKAIINVVFNDKGYEALQNLAHKYAIMFPKTGNVADFKDAHALVSYGVEENNILLSNSWEDWGIPFLSRTGMTILAERLQIAAPTIKRNIQSIIKLKCSGTPLSDAGTAAAAAPLLSKGVGQFIADVKNNEGDAKLAIINSAVIHSQAYTQAYTQAYAHAEQNAISQRIIPLTQIQEYATAYATAYAQAVINRQIPEYATAYATAYAQAVINRQSPEYATAYATAYAQALSQGQPQAEAHASALAAVSKGGSKSKPQRKSKKRHKNKSKSKRRNNRRTYKKNARKTKRRRRY
jgi:hypothetical protein